MQSINIIQRSSLATHRKFVCLCCMCVCVCVRTHTHHGATCTYKSYSICSLLCSFTMVTTQDFIITNRTLPSNSSYNNIFCLRCTFKLIFFYLITPLRKLVSLHKGRKMALTLRNYLKIPT